MAVSALRNSQDCNCTLRLISGSEWEGFLEELTPELTSRGRDTTKPGQKKIKAEGVFQVEGTAHAASEPQRGQRRKLTVWQGRVW